ncbi:DUF3846 domain-containing protein [Microbacterium maritypicum]|uniref:DUF3846 domain-containing protein n=1 Tax=Microbacterium maritypicum TaxID=33918 RepID=UPI003A8FADB9
MTTLTNEIATHSDGTICATATTTADCPHNHTYTAAETPATGVKGLLVSTTGEIAIAAFTELEDYQRAVGGYITTVELDERHDAIANDEGLIYKLPFNLLASMLTRRPLVGNVVIVGFDRRTGEFVDVDPSVVEHARRGLDV